MAKPTPINQDLTNLAISERVVKLLESNQYKADDSADMFPVSSFELLNANWNKAYFYKLIIAKAKNDGSYETVKIQNMPLVYNLPISPQNISINSPFATQTTILSDGVLVESNGSPLKQINFQGTTGILPYRDTEQTSFDTGALSAFAPNIGRVANNVKQAIQAFDPSSTAELIRKKQNIFDNSGYALFHKLSQFLNYYAFLSKQPENKDLRLVFDMVKDNTTYVCTPKNFSLIRTAGEPLEYKYSIQLEAWKRIKLDGGASNVTKKFETGLGGTMNAILAQVRRAFKLIAAAAEMINAVRGDIQRLLDIVRTVALSIKQITGIVVSLLDLPQSVIGDVKGAVYELVGASTSSGKAIASAWKRALATNWGPAITASSDNSLIPTKVTLTGVNSTVAQSSNSTGSGIQGSDQINNTTPGRADQAQATQTGAPEGNLISQAFDDPLSNIDFFDNLNVNDLNLSQNIKIKINQELQRVSSLTRKDYEDYRNYINEVSNDIANAFGKGSTRLNNIKGYVSTNATTFSGRVTREQYELLVNLRKVAQSLDVLASSNINNKSPLDESFNFIGKLAGSAVPFRKFPGKFAAPVPYGASIQDIARQYLGDANNATEIIILNKLLPPYIDEDGEFQDVLSSSYKRTFNIADGSALYINQKIIFYASNLAPFSRKIVNLQENPDGTWQVQVDGTTDLNLLISRNPRIQYFSRNTVSSRDLIYIPSNSTPIDIPDRLKPIPAFAPDSDPLISLAKIDMALDTDGDLILDSIGELKLAGGLNNILQALRIKFSTPLGSLNKHPGFGFGIRPGTPISEINFDALRQSVASTILSDKRFKEVLSIDITYTNSTLKITGVVSLNGVDNGVLPFNFDLQS
jgi:hypothetical protein